jgi:prepilin-type N-terminal cleavage/methylation domain-containing protein/prepilin-type processing-associated H-X9-DG protein
MNTSKSSRGFTLIELLVVIAIIAILAGILFPVFAAAKEAAKAAACLSNTKQLILGATMYGNDYDDTVIPWETAADSEGTNAQVLGAWTSTIQPYIKNAAILLCPSFNQQETQTAADNNQCDGNGSPDSGHPGELFIGQGSANPSSHILSDYGIARNALFGTLDPASCYPIHNNAPYTHQAGSGWEIDSTYTTTTTYATLSQSQVQQVANAAIFADAWTSVSGGFTGATSGAITPAGVVRSRIGCEGTGRHKGSGSNLSFLDGHAKYVPGDSENSYLSTLPNGCKYKTFFAYDVGQ